MNKEKERESILNCGEVNGYLLKVQNSCRLGGI